MTEQKTPKKRGRPKGSKNKAIRPKKQSGTIADIIRAGLLAGKPADAILRDVKKAFPKAKTSVGAINNYRSKMRRDGVEVPTIRSRRKSSAKATTKAAAQTKKKRAKRKTNITSVIRKALLAGKTNDEVIAEVKAVFPKAKTGRNFVVVQRSAMRQEGKRVPNSWEAQRVAKATMPAAPAAPSKAAATTVAIASDHAGVELKAALKKVLRQLGLKALDLGTHKTDSVDYPDYADAIAHAMASGKATRGVAICGSGIGISIAINRHRHIRAALCTSGQMARLARQHNDANVLALAARLSGVDVAKECLEQFIATKFEGGRHNRRVKKMS
jgi:ribose 5-phosphate isomerase B